MTFGLNAVWRYARLDELRRAHDDATERLSGAERAEGAHWRNPGRRGELTLARALARQVVVEKIGNQAGGMAAIEILSRDSLGRSVRPVVTVAGLPAPISLSISHTKRGVLVAVCEAPGVSIGVDLVEGTPLGNGFVQSWFDEQERLVASADGELAACRLWAAKEAVYKAVNQNDPFAPRQISLHRGAGEEIRCSYRGVDLGDRCWIRTWGCDGQFAAVAVFNRGAAGDMVAVGKPNIMTTGRQPADIEYSSSLRT
jgi:phosphopantetheinyl transferase